MAGNIVLAAGLLMFICAHSGIGSSEVVPDGVVYTEVKKTLVQGVPGVLTCRFYKDPQAVYWKKGSNPDDASLMLLWHEGQVSGPRYHDESCSIDENYSLIIKNLSLVDAGRYYCLVSNYLGILINNYTDVSVVDNAIETKSQVTLQMRPDLRGEVQCTVHIRPRMVSWIKKSTSSSSDETLVIFENNGAVAKRSSVGYDKGIYNISEDYSLVISDVQVHNEGIYTCNVTDFDTGITFQGDTFVDVVAQPREPFPTILECLQDESDLSYCLIPAQTELTLTCQVSEYYPDISLSFLYGSEKVEILGTTERNNTDGTKNKTITIASHGSKELYTCVASNISGTFLSRSTSALLHDREDLNRVVLVAVLTCVAAIILFSSMTYFIWRKKHHHSDRSNTQVGKVELESFHDKDVKELTHEEKQALLNERALLKHYRRIYDLTYTKSPLQVKRIIRENMIAVFDSEKMLNDWQQNPESTYRQYMKAMQVAISPEDKSDNVWPFNEELTWISRHLNQESEEEICKKLKITYKPEDSNDEGKKYNILREWRNKVAHENIEEKHNQLSSAIGSKKLRGLLPPLKGRFIYKVELIDLAFQLLMHDLLPITDALGINAIKLLSYRPVFQYSHFEIGTINLLSKLLKSVIDNKKKSDKGKMRYYFYSRIGRMTYYNVAARGLVAYDMSYRELFAISAAMTVTKRKAGGSQGNTSKAATQCEDGKSEESASSKIREDEKREAMTSISEAGVSQALPGDTSKAATQSEDHKGEKGAASNTPEGKKREETENENPGSETPLLEESRDRMSEPEKADKDTATMGLRTGIRMSKVPEDLVDLQHVLQLTDQDIADCLASSHPITEHALFKIWKEKPRPSVFNYRAALVHELRGIQMIDVADDVIAGKYIKVQTSLDFVKNMLQGLSRDRLSSLGEILNLSGKDEQWHTSTPLDVVYGKICHWVEDWTKEMIKVFPRVRKVRDAIAEVTPLKKILKSHRDLNDKLVRHGFLDLAREIMIIEQQVA